MTFFCCFIFSFQDTSKLCCWLLWKFCTFEILPAHFEILKFCWLFWKFFGNFAMQTFLHFHWIKNFSISKRPCTHHPDGTCGLIFFVYGVFNFLFFVHLIHLILIKCSQTGFKMLSNSVLHKWNIELTIVKFQPFFFLRRHLDFDVTITVQEPSSLWKSDVLLMPSRHRT